MSGAQIITTLVLALTTLAFFLELLPAGQVAMLAAAALAISGVISGDQVFAGFANPATITVGAMFVISAGLHHTGALDSVGTLLSRMLDRSRVIALTVLCVGAGLLSAFVNNTTIVAIMLPIVVASAREARISASRLLMPLSFAAMLGGTCTLIGTSTNLIVSSLAEAEGLAPISMFELAPVGVILFVITLGYLLLPGRWLVPERRAVEPEATDEDVREYVVDLQVTSTIEAGSRAEHNPAFDKLDVDLVEIWRDGEALGGMPNVRTRLVPGDVVRLHCTAEDMRELLERDEFRAVTAPEMAGLGRQDVVLVEALVGHRSSLVGHRVDALGLRERLGIVALGLLREGVRREGPIGQQRLEVGDLLLLACDRERVDELERRGELVLVSKVVSQHRRKRRLPIAVAILLGVVGVAASGALAIATAALVGAVLALATGCVRLDEAVEAIDWNVMLLLAGVLSLGVAMTESGAAAAVAEGFVGLAADLDPRLAIGLIYTATALLTSVLSNTATAALLTPVTFDIAAGLEISPRPLIMAVAFGASTALLTPVGYQTNVMVYGAGRYRFSDYARVGGPLMLLLIPTVAIAIPLIWPP